MSVASVCIQLVILFLFFLFFFLWIELVVSGILEERSQPLVLSLNKSEIALPDMLLFLVLNISVMHFQKKKKHFCYALMLGNQILKLQRE